MTDKTSRIRKILRSKPYVEFAYLFGSRVKGSVGEGSDWDIALHCNKSPSKLPAWTIFYLEAEYQER